MQVHFHLKAQNNFLAKSIVAVFFHHLNCFIERFNVPLNLQIEEDIQKVIF